MARTDDLRPIPVAGSDETGPAHRDLQHDVARVGRIPRAAGAAGRRCRTRAEDTPDVAAYECRVAHGVDGPGAQKIPDNGMAELRSDVVAQIEELSTLVGDLVDLARDDARSVVHEAVDMTEVIERCLERVRRRRLDIEFRVDIIGWQIYGDAAGLSRAVLNLLDNAAKWSRRAVTCRTPAAPGRYGPRDLLCRIAGRASQPTNGELVFERFYRSTSARAMPGSGLGLAIVKASRGQTRWQDPQR